MCRGKLWKHNLGTGSVPVPLEGAPAVLYKPALEPSWGPGYCPSANTGSRTWCPALQHVWTQTTLRNWYHLSYKSFFFFNSFDLKKKKKSLFGNSLVVYWLGLRRLSPGSSPGSLVRELRSGVPYYTAKKNFFNPFSHEAFINLHQPLFQLRKFSLLSNNDVHNIYNLYSWPKERTGAAATHTQRQVCGATARLQTLQRIKQGRDSLQEHVDLITTWAYSINSLQSSLL